MDGCPCQAPVAAKGAGAERDSDTFGNDHLLHWGICWTVYRLGPRHKPKGVTFSGVNVSLSDQIANSPPSRNMREQNQACKATPLRVLGT